jgi:hypothetical protein
VAIMPPAGHRFDEVMVLQKQNVVLKKGKKERRGTESSSREIGQTGAPSVELNCSFHLEAEKALFCCSLLT